MTNLSLLEQRFKFQECILIPFVNMLTKTRLGLINLLPDKECFINCLCKNSVILLLLSKRFPKVAKSIIYIIGSLPKSSMMTYYDKLRSSNPGTPSMLTILLFKILLQELTLKEKDYKPFWTPAYKALSEKLLLPIEIDSLGSVLNFSDTSLRQQEEKSQLLTIREIKVQNRNSLKTCCPSFTSTVVNKWVKEVTVPEMKAVKIQLKINKYKKSVFQQWFKSSNYTYNKSLNAIQKGHPDNFQSLRDKFVTANTKKTHPEYQRISSLISKLRIEKKTSNNKDAIDNEIENYNKQLKDAKKEMKSVKNIGVCEWELQTPKEIRAEAIQDLCKAYKTAYSNLRQGNIKRFNIGFRKKKDKKQSLVIPKSFIKNIEGKLTIAPTFFSKEENPSISMGKRTMKKYKNIEIKHDCRLVKKHNEYWLFIPVSLEEKTKNVKWKNYSGVDPGERTFMTTFGNQGCYEYEHNRNKVANTDKRIKLYKQRKKNIRKRSYLKQERRKENLIDEIHWCTIKALLKNNDILFYGDIKSHNIVRGNKNQTLNRGINNLKFYQFKQRLEFKASEQGKKVILVKEHNTTKTCSFCGTLNDPGSSKIYECKNCKKKVGRDVNASKNILMKGMKAYL